MKSSPTIQNLAQALVAALAEMPAIAFDSTNPFLRNKYASLGAVISTSRPVLAKHGLTVTQFAVSGRGTVKHQAFLDKTDPESDYEHTERDGTIDIGVETVIMHASGEWISGELLVPISKEKGKSNAQMAGSIITYLRRYGWAAAAGLYADEDTDGNTPPSSRGGDDEGGFDAAWPQKPSGRAVPSQPQSKVEKPSKPAPTPVAASAPPPPATPIDKLRAKMGAAEPDFVHFLRNRKNERGEVAMIGDKLEDLTADWQDWCLKNWDAFSRMVGDWLPDNPRSGSAPPSGESHTPPVDEGPDSEPAPGDAWRTFLMPWGEKKGTPLGKLDRKYLYGLCMNYKVEEFFKGKAVAPERLQADRLFRSMLDQCAAHYKFHESK